MSALAVSLVTAVVTATLAVVGTYFTTRRNLEATFDTSLRELRLGAYKTLWKDLGALAKYDRPDTLAKAEAEKLAATLRTWYFATGGLVLSHGTRQDYFALLDALETVKAAPADPLTEEDDEFLRVLGSRLRTGMTADVGTRRSFPFGDDERVAEPTVRTYEDAAGGRTLVVRRGPRRFLLFGRHRLTLTGTDVSGTPHHDPARRSFSAAVGGDDRVFLLEGGELVEGPKGWKRWDTRTRRGSAVWRERDPDAQP